MFLPKNYWYTGFAVLSDIGSWSPTPLPPGTKHVRKTPLPPPESDSYNNLDRHFPSRNPINCLGGLGMIFHLHGL